MNSFHKIRMRRLYAWNTPQNIKQRPARKETDYCIINERYRNCIKSAKANPGDDVISDQILP